MKYPRSKIHDSMRGWFNYYLFKEMEQNEDIWIISIDLGYGMFDRHFKHFPERVINVGASEQAATGIAVGLAEEGKIPFLYSITTFLLYRPFETIRNYINHEKIPVKLISSGRDKDYSHDGFSHHSEEAKQVLNILSNIYPYWPTRKEEIPLIIKELIENNQPSFLSLRR